MRGAAQRMPCPRLPTNVESRGWPPNSGSPIMLFPFCRFENSSARVMRFPRNLGHSNREQNTSCGHVDSPHTDSITLVASHGPK